MLLQEGVMVMTRRERRILKLAIETFGDEGKAKRWLHRSNIKTGNKPPITLLATAKGARTVETLLYQMIYGIVA
jgi:putative toxin-antitoxin system antitoxin component (TIGR02293 family)